MKTITLEEIYADPHVLDPLIAGSESVKIVGLGGALAVLTPTAERTSGSPVKRFSAAKHRAWFLKAYGPDAYESKRTTADIFDELRRERSPRGE